MMFLSDNAYAKRWNRIILSIFWVALLIAFICQIFITNLLDNRLSLPPKRFMMIDSFPIYLGIISLLLVLEVIVWKSKSWAIPAIILSSHVMSYLVVLHIYREIHVAPVVFIFPLLVTIIFFRPVFWFSSIPISVIELTWLYWRTPSFDLNALVQIIIICGVIAASYLTGLGVIWRGRELAESLQKSLESEQELLVQNIIMDRMSKIDPLTGLYNHKSFQEYFDKLVSPEQSRTYPFQLAVIDIDNFKRVNDTYGHAVGDIALKQVALSIQMNMESNDFAARYGGEEFVVLLHEKSDQLALAKLEKIRKNIARTPIEEMNRLPVTISIGLHSYEAGETKIECFEKADNALYESKKNGKNRITVL